MKNILITKAEYEGNFVVKLFFNDNTIKSVDFSKWLKKNSHPQYDMYKSESQFRKFKIEQGNIVWGSDWDLIFPVYQLYKGKLS